MATLGSTLENVCNRNDDFCCLCFTSGTEVSVHVEDEVLISYCGTETYLPVAELLSSVLGYAILDYIFTFTHVCKKCLHLAISSYSFIKKCKFNSNLLTKTVINLSSSLENTQDKIDSCQVLFVSLNTEDFTSKQFYDIKKRGTNKSMARKRYNILNSLYMKPKVEERNLIIKNEFSGETSKKHGHFVIPISTKNMMYDENDSVIRCKECLKMFTSATNLRNHYIKIHAPKIYNCTECNKGFGSPSFLETHKSDSHCPMVCSECGKTFKNKYSFKSHEFTHYMTLVCHDCGRVYKNNSTFKKHKELNICGQKTRASPANAKYTCDYCNKKYTQKVSLRVHIQYEHGNYKHHVCNICHKKFWAQSRLKAHMVKHTKEKNFICTICEGKFVTKEALLYHTRIHTGEKPYECNQCDARFLSASRRSEHVKRHHTNATLPCDVCGSKFNSQNYLQKHKKGHVSTTYTGRSDTPHSIKVTPQKANHVDIVKLSQELKIMSNEDYKIGDQHVYLEFDI